MTCQAVFVNKMGFFGKYGNYIMTTLVFVNKG